MIHFMKNKIVLKLNNKNIAFSVANSGHQATFCKIDAIFYKGKVGPWKIGNVYNHKGHFYQKDLAYSGYFMPWKVGNTGHIMCNMHVFLMIYKCHIF